PAVGVDHVAAAHAGEADLVEADAAERTEATLHAAEEHDGAGRVAFALDPRVEAPFADQLKDLVGRSHASTSAFHDDHLHIGGGVEHAPHLGRPAPAQGAVQDHGL